MNAQQLKNAILQEAIEGRLVPQDPNDEPASALLASIRKEKERLVKEGKLKKKDLEVKPISEDEIPFEIPESWEWVRLKSLVSVLGDGIHGTPEYDITGSYYFINGNNLSNNKIVIKADTKKVNEKEYQTYKKELNDRTILVSINGTIGNVGHYNGEPVILGKSACYYNLLDISLKSYITMLMYTDYFLKYAVENATGSTIKNVSLAVMNDFLIPLPPVAEQHRIVAKIEELLPKVEEYGKAQDALNKLNEELPERLKKSILQEAIEGRLVPQDPNDEPASVLLDRIRKEKARLVKEGKLKKKDLIETPIEEDEIPFKIPESWEWHRIGYLANLYTGNSISKDVKESKYMNVKGRWYIATKDVNFDNTIDYDNGVYIPEQDESQFKLASKGSILMCIEGGSAGRKIGVIDRDVCFGNKLCCFYSYGLYNLFLYYYLQSTIFKEIFNDNKKGIIGGVSINMMTPLLIPVPPLAEQKRIVAKIEELFEKIDKLKK
jgi:type I restriction enzyme S subunit